MKRRVIFVISILILISSSSPMRLLGQLNLVNFDEQADYTIIPFELRSNLILIPVKINGFPPLKFIFDSGAENVILLEGALAPVMGLEAFRPVYVSGTDKQRRLKGFVSVGVSLEIGEVDCIQQNIVVLNEEELMLQNLIGEDVHGILSAHLFQNFIIKIDYRRQRIFLYRRNAMKKLNEKYRCLPIEMKNHKPYIRADILTGNDSLSHLKLLLDTGAGIGLMMNTHTHPKLHVPNHVLTTNIGTGLSGQVTGYVGRTTQLQIGPFDFHGVITNYQHLEDSVMRITPDIKNGTIGNLLLNRFTLVMDYLEQKIYLRPNRKYNSVFKYDKSGLTLIATGDDLTDYYVNFVIDESPAQRSGIRKGDRILSVNGIPSSWLSLNGIIHKLQGKDDKKISIKVKRGNEKIKFAFRLEKIL